MATRTTCDGTGVVISDDTPVTGIMGHQYCDDARPVAEMYLADVSELHTKHAQAFTLELQELRARYREKLSQLPDE
jgi:hypothetical protein